MGIIPGRVAQRGGFCRGARSVVAKGVGAASGVRGDGASVDVGSDLANRGDEEALGGWRGGNGRGRRVERLRRRREWEADGARRQRGRRSRCGRRWGLKNLHNATKGGPLRRATGLLRRVPHRGGGGGVVSVVFSNTTAHPGRTRAGTTWGAARAVDVARLVGAVAAFPSGEVDAFEGAIGGGELEHVGEMFGGRGPF